MGEVVNLRQARKAKARKDAAVQADAQRALHGRTRAERQAQESDSQRAERLLDGAKRED